MIGIPSGWEWIAAINWADSEVMGIPASFQLDTMTRYMPSNGKYFWEAFKVSDWADWRVIE